MKYACAALLLVWSLNMRAQQFPLGTWTDELPYRTALMLAQTPDRVYCATDVSLYSVNKSDLSTEKISKCTGLSDIGFSALAYDAARDQLVIAYANSNIDLYRPTGTVNVPDIKNKNIVGDKSIYSINIVGNLAYLGCGFGMVVLDLDKHEIKDTYYLGPNGNDLKVTAAAVSFGKIFAATADGLYAANANSAALSNYNEWTRLDTAAGLPHRAAQHLLSAGNLYASFNDSLFAYDGNQWSLVYVDNGFNIQSIQFFNDSLYLCEYNSTTDIGAIAVLHNNTLVHVYPNNVDLGNPRDLAVDESGRMWVADPYRQFHMFQNGNARTIYPNGPYTNSVGRIAAANGEVYVAPSVPVTGGYQYNRDGFFVYSGFDWHNYGAYDNGLFDDSLLDFVCVAHDAASGKTYFGSLDNGGVFEYAPDHSTIYKQGFLYPDPNNFYNAYDLAVDPSGNLWVTNVTGIPKLVLKTADGTWQAFQLPGSSDPHRVYPDRFNQVWVTLRNDGIEVYNYGNDLLSTADDKFKHFGVGVGQGNLPSGFVSCMALDNNDEMWIGTDKGIAVVYCASSLFDGTCDAQQIIVSGADSLAGYLLGTEFVHAIAVDAGNRKWVGSDNGLWLLSEDGLKEIHHFTTDNSPLFSNVVNDIAVDNSNGAVYIGTDKGLMRYQSDATAPKDDNATACDTHIYPNPVTHDYNGPIAVRGLPYNATVKITDASGELVYQTKSNGGTATWNGNDYNGNRAASGVYYVTSISNDGKSTCQSKLVFTK